MWCCSSLVPPFAASSRPGATVTLGSDESFTMRTLYLQNKYLLYTHHSRQMGLLHGNFLESLWWIANVRVLQINTRLCWKCLTSDGVLSDVAPSASQGHAAEPSRLPAPSSLLSCHRSLDSFLPSTVNTMGVDLRDAFLACEDNKLASWLLLCNDRKLGNWLLAPCLEITFKTKRLFNKCVVVIVEKMH